MRKHVRLLAGAVSVLLAICSPSGFVFAEDPNNSVTYVVNSNEADGLADTRLTLNYKPDQVDVAIAAWNQWGGTETDTIVDDIRSRNDKNSFFMELSGSSNITFQGFRTTTTEKGGNAAVVLKPKEGYLITGLNAQNSLNNFYPTHGFDLTQKGQSSLWYYTGISEVASLAYADGKRYEIIFGFHRNYNDSKDIDPITVYSVPVDITVTAVPTKVDGKAVSDPSNVTVIPGNVVEITSTITPTKIDSSSAKLNVDFERDEQNNPVLSETINGTTTALKDGNLTKNADGSWTRTTSYTVTANDVATGKINYSIHAGLAYTASLQNVQLVTNATKEATAESTINVISHTLYIKGNSQEFTYDGGTHTVAGASVNGVACIPDENNNLSANVILAGTNYQVSNIVNQPASGIDAKPDYSNVIDTSGIVIKKINADGTLEPVADMKAFNIVPENGVMKINPASLSLAQVPDVTYNGQDQTLNKAQEQVIANAVSYLKPVQPADAANAVSVNAAAATNHPTPELGKDYTLQYEVVSGYVIDAGSVLRVTAVAKGRNYTGSSNSVDYKILPRPLRVGTNSNSKIYDGKALTAAGSIDGAVASDHLRLITTGSQTDVGSSQNTYRIDYGKAKASNYYVASESIGTLTVYAPAPKPNGRTCQQDGYAAGYAWDDAQQACVLRVRETSPSIKNVPGTGALRK